MVNPTDLPQIPGYEITRVLGRGGMADVFLATQLSLSRQVAIKIIAAERTQGRENVARFEHEARTIAQLDHPHIVSIFDVGQTADGRLYYTMPYLPRGDLAERTLDEAGILAIVRALCAALGYAHELGIVHRDVKPENVLFDQRDNPLLADFGIALSTREIARVTREGSTIGSAGYMSPEQARGLTLDGRADLYSLGVVTFELLSGELPFHGIDTLSMALAHVEQPIPHLPPLRRRWQAFIDKAMAKSAADRFQTAAEMAAALDEIESGMREPERTASQPSRSRTAPVLAGVVVLIGAAMLANVMFRSRSPVVHVADTASAPGADAPPSEPATVATAPRADTPEVASTTATAEAVPAPAPGRAESSDALQVAPSQIDFAAGTALRDPGGPELVFVPDAHEGEASGFALARYEVTRGEYAAFASATHRAASNCREPLQPWSRLRKLSWRNPGFAQNDRHPVVCVSWSDASAYAQWLSERTHAQYTLPTRAEWLHAARSALAGVSACAQGNLAGHNALPFLRNSGCKSGFLHTAPVGGFKPNAVGVYDLLGNVSEWTLGCKPAATDKSGHCLAHLFSGTSWRDDARANNLDAVGDADTDIGYTTVGIRVLRKLDADNLPQRDN